MMELYSKDDFIEKHARAILREIGRRKRPYAQEKDESAKEPKKLPTWKQSQQEKH